MESVQFQAIKDEKAGWKGRMKRRQWLMQSSL